MIKYKTENGALICTFTGRLDTASCSQWEKDIYEKVSQSDGPIIFDLNKIDYIASMFLRICIKVAKEVGTENFSLINVSPFVKKVFKIAGLDNQIKIEPDR